MQRKSIGIIEARGLLAGVQAADAAMKSANVELIGYEFARGDGWTTIKVTGDVGAVKAAVDAARIAAEKVTGVVTTRVIARPSAGLDMLIYNKDTVGYQPPEPPAPETPTPEEVPAVEEIPVVEETPAVEEISVIEEAPMVEEPPVVEETPAVEEAPAVKEISVVEETPSVEETPIVEEAPVVEETLDETKTPVEGESEANTSTSTQAPRRQRRRPPKKKGPPATEE